MKLRWVSNVIKLNCGDIFNVLTILSSRWNWWQFLITQHINHDLEKFSPVSFECTVSGPCLSNHRDNKFTRWLAHSPLLFTCEKSTDRNWSPLLTYWHGNGTTLEKSHFTLKYGFHKHDTPWLIHACLRGYSALTSESFGQYQHEDVASAK